MTDVFALNTNKNVYISKYMYLWSAQRSFAVFI